MPSEGVRDNKQIPEAQKSLEELFAEETHAKAIRDARLAAIIASIAFALFNIVDYLAYPRLYLVFLVIRICVVVGNMIILGLMRTGEEPNIPFYSKCLSSFSVA